MIPIPINDNIRRRIFWAATLVLILANVLAFIFELSQGAQLNRLIYTFAIIPARYTSPRGSALPGLGGLLVPVFASMFLHAGWLHLIGNMLFLFVFGRSVEDRYGHWKFILIYFLSGFVAALTHIFYNAGSRLPTIGASGAIAGILGAYIVCFPGARISTLIWVLVFFWRVEIPALIILGYWFLIQFIAASAQQLDIQSAARGGTAWWAHVGGFFAGAVLALIFRPRRPKVEIIPPY
ncbi:MAG TPA: rhomboid family intramembrane serine protease [Terriglobia bacterium]|nr:rhomboid family intramembrane serine protease [Terriglobia bacterium]